MWHPLIGEFLGTLTLIVFGGGNVASVLLKHSKAEHAGWLAICTAWFIAVMLGVFVAQSAGSPNADLNPAVSLAKYWLGMYTFEYWVVVSLVQIAGGCVGGVIVWLAYLQHWKPTESAASKLAVFSTIPAIRHYPSNVLTEVIGAFFLVFGVGAIFGHATDGHLAIGMGPYLVGVLVWGLGLSLGGPTGYAINPARDLGPRIAHAILPIAGKGSSDWAYAWVPIIGPLLGASLGAAAWKLFF